MSALLVFGGSSSNIFGSDGCCIFGKYIYKYLIVQATHDDMNLSIQRKYMMTYFYILLKTYSCSIKLVDTYNTKSIELHY